MVAYQSRSFPLDIEDGLGEYGCDFLETERVVVFGQDARLSCHALEVGPKDHQAVVLEHNEVKDRHRLALDKTLPDADSDHAHLHREHNDVGEEATHDACTLTDKPHL